jgi:hypothetical protein
MESTYSDDIQAAGSDTRPPMLDRTDYESWAQRIRLYCLGKENGDKILKSIDEGPFRMGITRDTIEATDDQPAVVGPDRPRTYNELSDEEKKRYDADVRASNIVIQGLPKYVYKLINYNTEAKAVWDNVKMLLAGSELTKEDRESQLYDEFEVPHSLDLNNPTNSQGVYDSVQLKNVVNTYTIDMENSNIISYERYVSENGPSVVLSNTASVDLIEYELHEHIVCNPDDSLTTRLNILKDQVSIYEQRAKFELTEREQKMEWQMRAYITENNSKQETLKRELISLQKQLNQSVKQKLEIQKGLTSLKHDYKDKETKLLNDFSNFKTLKNKLEEKLYTQGQTIQSAQMMQNHRTLRDEFSEQNASKPKAKFLRNGIGAQPALYDANTMFEPNHAPQAQSHGFGRHLK